MAETKPLLEPTIEFVGPVAIHNMPCAVIANEKAVFDCNSGIFEPSWSAQSDGYVLILVRNTWLRRKLTEWFPLRAIRHVRKAENSNV